MSISSLKTNVTDEELASVRNFCKLDEGVEDELLKVWLLAARREIMGSVGEQVENFYEDNPVFTQAVWILVFNHFNDRTSASTAYLSYNRILRDDINSLKDDYRYELEQQQLKEVTNDGSQR